MTLSQEFLLGIDIGTQRARAALYDPRGRLQVIAAQDYDLQTPAPGWAQQDPRLWWEASLRNIRSLLERSGIRPSQILCVAIDSQMHAAIPLGRDGQVLVPAVQLWCDKRCADVIAGLTPHLALSDAYTWAANVPTTSWLGFKIKWIQIHQPEIYAATSKFLTGGSYITYQLTGEMSISLAEASGSFLMDARRGTWSELLLQQLDIDRAKLPAIAPAASIAGHITPDAARATGLAAGTPVTVGASDLMAALLAAGLTEPGYAADVSGTSCLMAISTPAPIRDPRLMNLHHEIEGWVAYGVVESGGGALRWFRDQFCQPEVAEAQRSQRSVYDLMIDRAAQVPPGAEGVMFFPYLLGERTLGSPHSRGVFFGLTPRSDKAALTRAIMEGITFELRRTLEIVEEAGIPVQQIRVVGGAAASTAWNQIRADIYGKPVIDSATNEGSVLGAVILGGLAAGVWPRVQAAVSTLCKPGLAVQPNPAHRSRYEALYALFKELHDQLIPPFERMRYIMGHEGPLDDRDSRESL